MSDPYNAGMRIGESVGTKYARALARAILTLPESSYHKILMLVFA